MQPPFPCSGSWNRLFWIWRAMPRFGTAGWGCKLQGAVRQWDPCTLGPWLDFGLIWLDVIGISYSYHNNHNLKINNNIISYWIVLYFILLYCIILFKKHIVLYYITLYYFMLYIILYISMWIKIDRMIWFDVGDRFLMVVLCDLTCFVVQVMLCR